MCSVAAPDAIDATASDAIAARSRWNGDAAPHRDLPPAAHRQQRGPNSHLRLAKSDIPEDQAIHRRQSSTKIFLDVEPAAPLPRGHVEAQSFI